MVPAGQTSDDSARALDADTINLAGRLQDAQGRIQELESALEHHQENTRVLKRRNTDLGSLAQTQQRLEVGIFRWWCATFAIGHVNFLCAILMWSAEVQPTSGHLYWLRFAVYRPRDAVGVDLVDLLCHASTEAPQRSLNGIFLP